MKVRGICGGLRCLQGFWTMCDCDLDLWPVPLKINRLLDLGLSNQHAKFGLHWWKGICAIVSTNCKGRTEGHTYIQDGPITISQPQLWCEGITINLGQFGSVMSEVVMIYHSVQFYTIIVFCWGQYEFWWTLKTKFTELSLVAMFSSWSE